jgi:hypothetical protein
MELMFNSNKDYDLIIVSNNFIKNWTKKCPEYILKYPIMKYKIRERYNSDNVIFETNIKNECQLWMDLHNIKPNYKKLWTFNTDLHFFSRNAKIPLEILD